MKVVLGLTEGSNVRNLFEMGFIQRLFESYPDKQVELVVVTPAANIKQFIEKWKLNENIIFAPIMPFRQSSNQKRLAHIRRLLVKKGFLKIAAIIRNWERKIVSSEAYYRELLNQCDIVVCSHIHLPFEQPLANMAYSLGIPVLGIVNSWDNVFKGIETHVDHVIVWNEIQKSEMEEMEGYSRSDISVGGIPAFIPYFQESCKVSREEFCRMIGFDPTRPIVTYASIGQFVPFFEETFILEEILKFRDECAPDRQPQVVCRLHPWSKKELFSSFFNEKDLYFNGFSNYTPTLNWTPTFDEVAFAGNLLRHSDICISPGSTMSIEAPIFNTPVIVPVYNDYQPEVWKDYYSRFCLAMHFGKLVKGGYANIVRNHDEFKSEFFMYLNHPETNLEVREKLVKDYIGNETDPIGKILFHADRLVSNHRKMN